VRVSDSDLIFSHSWHVQDMMNYGPRGWNLEASIRTLLHNFNEFVCISIQNLISKSKFETYIGMERTGGCIFARVCNIYIPRPCKLCIYKTVYDSIFERLYWCQDGGVLGTYCIMPCSRVYHCQSHCSYFSMIWKNSFRTLIIHGPRTGSKAGAKLSFFPKGIWIVAYSSHSFKNQLYYYYYRDSRKFDKNWQKLLWKETYVAPGKATAIVFEPCFHSTIPNPALWR